MPGIGRPQRQQRTAPAARQADPRMDTVNAGIGHGCFAPQAAVLGAEKHAGTGAGTNGSANTQHHAATIARIPVNPLRRITLGGGIETERPHFTPASTGTPVAGATT